MSPLMCKTERILMTATKTHAVVWGIFNRRAFFFFFLLIVGGAIKAQTTEPRHRSDLLQGGLEVLCVDSCFLILTGLFQRSPFNLHALMLRHVVILHHIMLTFCDQFSICASFENNIFLSDAYLEHLRYLCLYSTYRYNVSNMHSTLNMYGFTHSM